MTLPGYKGWAPDLYRPMEASDGLLVRVKPFGARIAADQARALAAASQRHGNGEFQISNRANIQFRGFTPEGVAAFAEEACALGLADTEPEIERRRNILVSPLGADDSSAAFDSIAVGKSLGVLLRTDRRFAELPPKFRFLVDGGGVLPLSGTTADVMVRGVDGGAEISIAGGRNAVRCTQDEIAAVTKAIVLAFLDLGAGEREPPRRMRMLVATFGEAAVFGTAGVSAEAEAEPLGPPPPPRAGFVPVSNSRSGAFLIGVPFGQSDGEFLAQCAGLAEQYGNGVLRTTPWRAFAIGGVAAGRADDLAHAAVAIGAVASADDHRLAIAACPGTACASGAVDSRADAARFAEAAAPLPAAVHISGCAKGCAYAGAANLTLLGTVAGYDVILGGATTDSPAIRGLSIGDVIDGVESGFLKVPQ